jgi:hypothetical protein
MIDFNNAPEQKEGGGGNGPIPPLSFVKVKLTLRAPSEKQKSNIHPSLTISKNNAANHYLDCEFEVVGGTYAGVKIWGNYVVAGSEKATNISMAFFKAALSAARGVQLNDASPQATQARTINDWPELNGMMFPVLVDVKQPRAGDRFINNEISKAVAPGDEQYQIVMSGGEIISDKAIPEIPQAAGGGTAGTAQPQNQGQAWGNPPPPTEPPQGQQSLPGMQNQQQQPGGQPGWAQQPT